jgi:hypothetical protein
MPTNNAIEKEEWLTVTQVARLLKTRYHKARDLILLGTFGESKYAGRTLLAPAKEVRSYAKRQH